MSNKRTWGDDIFAGFSKKPEQVKNPPLPSLTDVCPAVYTSFRDNGLLTTGVYVTPTDDSNLHEQLAHEICRHENEPFVTIIDQTTYWSVHVSERFAPIGRIDVLAMLDTTWRP